ncbi:unnamed protein product [Rhizoctonia solani]|uniref:Uncharacterized protein n=1 Tax=Rhizoctonia solani TaxID=456999 RepID=A0A8H2WCA7_9AGAM|nr:unnamed protein product [Rhizoctonia solani]
MIPEYKLASYDYDEQPDSAITVTYRCVANDLTTSNTDGVETSMTSNIPYHPVQPSSSIYKLSNEGQRFGPRLLESADNKWQSYTNCPSNTPLSSAHQMPFGSSTSQEYSEEYGFSITHSPYEVKHFNATLANTPMDGTHHRMAADCGPKRLAPTVPVCPTQVRYALEGQIKRACGTRISKAAELLAATTTGTRNREVYASIDRVGLRGHGKIRVRRPPEVRWNETMQCAYVSPITGCRCRVRLNRGPDLERHLRTVHLRQEVQFIPNLRASNKR